MPQRKGFVPLQKRKGQSSSSSINSTNNSSLRLPVPPSEYEPSTRKRLEGLYEWDDGEREWMPVEFTMSGEALLWKCPICGSVHFLKNPTCRSGHAPLTALFLDSESPEEYWLAEEFLNDPRLAHQLIDELLYPWKCNVVKKPYFKGTVPELIEQIYHELEPRYLEMFGGLLDEQDYEVLERLIFENYQECGMIPDDPLTDFCLDKETYYAMVDFAFKGLFFRE